MGGGALFICMTFATFSFFLERTSIILKLVGESSPFFLSFAQFMSIRLERLTLPIEVNIPLSRGSFRTLLFDVPELRLA